MLATFKRIIMNLFYLKILSMTDEKVDEGKTSGAIIAVAEVHCPTSSMDARASGSVGVIHIADHPSPKVCNLSSIKEYNHVLEGLGAGQFAL
jgi:hypothetical protein